ncbi:MAG: ABC transporter permease [Clostridium fessum]
MRFSDLLTMSVNNLFRRKLRTFLTVLGVVIGTASIVVMVSIGIGLKEFTIKQYSSYGSLTAIQVYNYNNGNSSDKKNPEDSFMTDETMKTFEKIPHVTSAYPDLNLNVIMRQGAPTRNDAGCTRIPMGADEEYQAGRRKPRRQLRKRRTWRW